MSHISTRLLQYTLFVQSGLIRIACVVVALLFLWAAITWAGWVA